MIAWGDVYRVAEATLPLYTSLALGYASVRWWRLFTPEQSDAVNKFVAYFAIPFFSLEFTLHVDPLAVNYRFLAADVVAKSVTLLLLAAWAAAYGGEGRLAWPVTTFSLSAITNGLLVGIPFLRAMYGPLGQDLMVQAFLLQALFWLALVLLALEYRKAEADAEGAVAEGAVEQAAAPLPPDGRRRSATFFWSVLKIALLKITFNPNIYSTICGLAWAIAASRWHLKLPGMVEGPVLIMSKTGAGMAMFSMGLFTAKQEKLMACGTRLTAMALLLRFVAAPLAMAVGCICVGLRGAVLRIAMVQAAAPPAVVSFVFGREYGLHEDVLSAAVIIGTLISIPVLVGYYAVMEHID